MEILQEGTTYWLHPTMEDLVRRYDSMADHDEIEVSLRVVPGGDWVLEVIWSYFGYEPISRDLAAELFDGLDVAQIEASSWHRYRLPENQDQINALRLQWAQMSPEAIHQSLNAEKEAAEARRDPAVDLTEVD